MSIIRVRDLEYRTKEQLILGGIGFDIQKGDYVALIGPNGGGKTTLVKVLLGLIEPTGGSVELFGDPYRSTRHYKKIGYVPQNVTLLDQNFPLSVYETVSLGLAAQKPWFSFLGKNDQDKIERALESASIAHLREKNLSELSGGQRQRVMIARALVSDPEILILDEPSTGVDIISQHKFYQFLKSLNTNKNITIIFITHDMGVIADDVNRVLAVNQELLYSGSARDMLCCEAVSQLYGTKSHIVSHHHHHHDCSGSAC